MPTINVLVAPYVVRNKPETERGHVVTGVAKGWQKTSLNQDPDEILTECKGLDALLTKSNLEADGVTKIDPSKPVGFLVSYEIHDPSAVLTTGLTITPATTNGEIGQVVELLATVAPANATYKGVNWYSGDVTKAVHIGGGKFKLLQSGSVTVYGVTVEGNHVDSTVITVAGALSLSTDLTATKDVTSGEDATFSVVAAGGTTPYTYAWYFSDVPGGAGSVIDAGTNATASTANLVVTAVDAADEGEYWCVVSDADGHSVTSTRCEMAVV